MIQNEFVHVSIVTMLILIPFEFVNLIITTLINNYVISYKPT